MLDPHDELDVGLRLEQAALHEVGRVVEHRDVEDLALRLDLAPRLAWQFVALKHRQHRLGDILALGTVGKFL